MSRPSVGCRFVCLALGPVVLAALSLLAGCRNASAYHAGSGTRLPPSQPFFELADKAEPLPIFDGHTGQPLRGGALLDRLAAAEVVILGEIHDDPIAHRLQHHLVRDLFARGRPRNGGALSLEMLTRADEGSLDGEQPLQQRLAQTSLANWLEWERFYLPTIEAALAERRPIIAANAPRDYVRLARVHGYDFLRALGPSKRRLFDLPPEEVDFSAYRERFETMMTAHAPTTQPTTTPTTLPGSQPAVELDVESFFDAQLIWDATMAQSIAAARRQHGRPIIHLVGSFHSDYDGALTALLEREGLEVMTVSFVPASRASLADRDRGRADVVIYTGSRK